jgi:hypothetical protein
LSKRILLIINKNEKLGANGLGKKDQIGQALNHNNSRAHNTSSSIKEIERR